MGLARDILVLFGVLPIDMPEFNNRLNDETFVGEFGSYNKIEKLSKLDGKDVYVKDFHKGFINGTLMYIPNLIDKYILKHSNKSEKNETLHIHDLEDIN
jgi:hypothetical protein